MEEAKHRTLWFWALLCLFVAGISVQQTFPIQNHDLFWHLAIGEQTLDAGHLLDEDPLTFNAAGKRWLQHEWGAQLLLAAVSRAGGWWGLRLLRGLLVGLFLALLALIFLRRNGNPSVALLGLLLAWVLLEPFSSMRPHLFGWVLLAGGYHAFLTRGPTWTWRRWAACCVWIVVSVNIHSSVLVVVLFCGLATLEILAWGLVRRALQPALLRHWLTLGAILALGTLLQPSGWRLYLYAARTKAFNATRSHEWLPLFRQDLWRDKPFLLTFFVLLVLLFLWALIRRIRRGRSSDCFPFLAPALATLALTLSTRRMLFLAFVPLHLALDELGDAIETQLSRAGSLWRRRWLAPASLTLAVLLVLGWSFERRSGPFEPRSLEPEFALTEAVGFLRETRLQGRMSNIDYWGGILSYFLGPELRTFIDGRWLMVGAQVFEDHREIQGHRAKMETLCDRYGIDYLIQPDEIWRRVPPLDLERWVLAYRDDLAVIALRRTATFEANRRRVCAYYRAHAERPAAGALPSFPACCCPDLTRETRGGPGRP